MKFKNMIAKTEKTMLATAPSSSFRFDEKAHAYFLNDKPLHGVTTVIGATLPKNLTWWAAGMALELLGWKNPKKHSLEDQEESAAGVLKGLKLLTPQHFNKLLQKCYRRHDEYKNERATQGTDTHAIVEDYINLCLADDGKARPLGSNFAVDENVLNFVEWAVKNEVKFLASEKKVYSETHWFAGTLDFLFEKDGKVFVGDVKTSKEIYPSYFIQAGAYQIALEEQGTKTDGTVIVKLNGELEEKWSYDQKRDRGLFLNTLEIYKALQTWK